MNLKTAMSMYGRGDNSTTDRMWYELALDICKHIQSLLPCDEQTALKSGIEYATQKINNIKKDGNDHEQFAMKIVNRLISLRASFTCRLSVEYVRHELENYLN